MLEGSRGVWFPAASQEAEEGEAQAYGFENFDTRAPARIPVAARAAYEAARIALGGGVPTSSKHDVGGKQ